MEVVYQGVLFKSKSSNTAIPSATTATRSKRNLSASVVGEKMESNKRRGVYVEKWVDPKSHAEGNKRQQKSKSPPTYRRDTNKLLTSAPAESKISTFTRLLGTPDPVVRFIKRNSHKAALTEKLQKQISKIPNDTTAKPSTSNRLDKATRNKVEISKNMKKMKFRSNVLKAINTNDNDTEVKTVKAKKEIVQAPSTSKMTREPSIGPNWSAIFPNQENNEGKNNLLQQYICNYEQTINQPMKEKDDTLANAAKGKDEPIYDFFLDLIESVCDEDVTDNDNLEAKSRKSSDIKLEIDDHVADVLVSQQDDANHFNITDEDYESTQTRELVKYYNRSRRTPRETGRRRRPMNKSFAYVPKCAYNPKEKPEKKAKKPNLFTLLKQQLSLEYTTQEPENMYEALRNIARNKHKRRQIYFESAEPSDVDGVCRFKRRNVISPSTRLPKKRPPNFSSINTTRGKQKSGSITSIRSHLESSHSIEVMGFDYDERDVMVSDGGYSDMDTAVNKYRDILNLNEGVTTVTHSWKDHLSAY